MKSDRQKTQKRFRDSGETIYEMMDEILVVCPQCEACARITPLPSTETPRINSFRPRRVVCSGCGFLREWEGRGLGFDWYGDPMRDSYFHLPLWLQAPCCGHILWAYNRKHLQQIASWVEADLREHQPHPKFGWRNKSLLNRLPRWILTAKHRQQVLKAIARLHRTKA